eukprot:COSAG06_NODE_88_length_24864_cov_7.159368_13_plen_189_part_00
MATRGLLRGQVTGGSRALLWRRRGLETCATPRWSRGEPRRRAGALLWRAWARPPRLLRDCSRSVASVRLLGLSGNCGAIGILSHFSHSQTNKVLCPHTRTTTPPDSLRRFDCGVHVVGALTPDGWEKTEGVVVVMRPPRSANAIVRSCPVACTTPVILPTRQPTHMVVFLTHRPLEHSWPLSTRWPSA